MTERWITQDKFYKPAEGKRGNCMQAAVASLLAKRLEDVTNFIEQRYFWGSLHKFVTDAGLILDEIDNKGVAPEGVCIATGPGPRDCLHAIIVEDGKLLFDPHPSRAGLLSIERFYVLRPRDIGEWRRYTAHDRNPMTDAPCVLPAAA